MNEKLDIDSKFLNGEKTKNVRFSYNDFVEIIYGDDQNKYGSIVSLISLLPEPLYLVELDESEGDREIFQSKIRLKE